MIFIISSLSGVGKSSLIQGLLKSNLYVDFLKNLQFSTSYVTRTPRPNEIDGKDYHFVSKKKFSAMIKNGLFLEYQVINHHYYGTCYNNMINTLRRGNSLIMDLSQRGKEKVVKSQVSQTCTIYIDSPKKKVLYNRIANRKKSLQDNLYKRIKKENQKINLTEKYDYTVKNEEYKKALFDLQFIILTKYLQKYQQNK